MTDYFVDASASGTGNGLTPTNAFVSVYSIPWADRDRAWVRNTHVELAVGSAEFGPGSGWAGQPGFDRYVSLIGWPQATETLYDERPASGVSAGWDTDQPSTQAYSSYGYKFPTFTGSWAVAGGSNPRTGRIYMTNFYLVNCGANGLFFTPWQVELIGEGGRFGTIVPLFNNGPVAREDGQPQFFDGPIIERLIVVGSQAIVGTQLFDGNCSTRMIEIHSKTIARELFSSQNAGHYHGHIVNYSNSVAYIVTGANGNNGSNLAQTPVASYIRRISGIKPYSGAYERPTGTTNQEGRWTIDDYYGEGPRTMRYQAHGMQTAARSEAQFNGDAAVWLFCNSVGSQKLAQANFPRVDPAVSEFFSVTSGTPIEIRVPLFADNTGVCSFGDGNMVAHLLAHGTKPFTATRSSVLVGSPTLWTGSLTQTGSAYFMSCVFNPLETGVAKFEFYAAQAPIQATSGAGVTCYWLVGKPLKV